MERIRGYRGLAPGMRGTSAVLGNFDGVHRGHQALIGVARDRAPTGAGLGVVTFEPHPRRYFQPDAPRFRLTTAEERARILARLGVDVIHELVFDDALAAMPAEVFAERVLAEGLGIRHLVVGEDFRFGKGRRGTAPMLREWGARLGFAVSIQHLVAGPEGAFSSSVIRMLLEQGRCEEAARQLGRWHTVSGLVIGGERRGRGLGYPTANLDFGEQLVPRYGIYAAEVSVHSGPYAGTRAGVASIGERPTFGVHAPNFEVHLFDFDGDLYGAEISAALVAFLRDELRFEGEAALVAQMDRDAAEARARLAAARPPAA